MPTTETPANDRLDLATRFTAGNAAAKMTITSTGYNAL